MKNSSRTSVTLFPPDAFAFWAALCEDSGAAACLVGTGGIIVACGPGVAAIMGKQSFKGDPVGKHLSDLMDGALAAERIEVVKEVAVGGAVIVLDGMVGGKVVRSIFRSMPNHVNGGACVLMTSRILSEVASALHDGHIVRKANHADRGGLSRLTERELEVLTLIGIGLSTAEIAERLGRSVKTIEWHRVSLGGKLGVSNRVELARIAMNSGLVGAGAAKHSSRKARGNGGDDGEKARTSRA